MKKLDKLNKLQYKFYRSLGKKAFDEGYHMLVIHDDGTMCHSKCYKGYEMELKDASYNGTLALVEHIPADFDMTKNYNRVMQLLNDYNKVFNGDDDSNVYEDYE